MSHVPTLEEICRDYGPNGILGYDLVNGFADVSSYTQVAAFTINGLLLGITRGQMQGKMAPLVRYVALALREWSRTQHFSYPERNHCWLANVPQLKRRACLDNRMLDALSRETLGTMEEPKNKFIHPGALTEGIAVALLGLQGAITGSRANAAALTEEADRLEQENKHLVQYIDELGTVQGIERIAEDELGLVDPDTVIIEPQQ